MLIGRSELKETNSYHQNEIFLVSWNDQSANLSTKNQDLAVIPGGIRRKKGERIRPLPPKRGERKGEQGRGRDPLQRYLRERSLRKARRVEQHRGLQEAVST